MYYYRMRYDVLTKNSATVLIRCAFVADLPRIPPDKCEPGEDEEAILECTRMIVRKGHWMHARSAFPFS